MQDPQWSIADAEIEEALDCDISAGYDLGSLNFHTVSAIALGYLPLFDNAATTCNHAITLAGQVVAIFWVTEVVAGAA